MLLEIFDETRVYVFILKFIRLFASFKKINKNN